MKKNWMMQLQPASSLASTLHQLGRLVAPPPPWQPVPCSVLPDLPDHGQLRQLPVSMHLHASTNHPPHPPRLLKFEALSSASHCGWCAADPQPKHASLQSHHWQSLCYRLSGREIRLCKSESVQTYSDDMRMPTRLSIINSLVISKVASLGL